jgi:hypothetical protein
VKPLIEEIGYVPGPFRLLAVLWLSFLMAGLATMVYFAAIDPMQLQPCVDFPVVSRTAAYTIGFLLFWLLTASSSLLCLFFLYPRRGNLSVGATEQDSRDRNQ